MNPFCLNSRFDTLNIKSVFPILLLRKPLESQHDNSAKQTTTETNKNYTEQKRPNGILKRTNFKALTPEFPPRHFKTNTPRSDWLTPQPRAKINKFEYTIQTRGYQSLKKNGDNIPPFTMNIPLSSRTEPDGQLDEPITSSPPSASNAMQKKQFVAPFPIQTQPQTQGPNKLSITSSNISSSPRTPLVPPYAVSIVNDQEVQDCYQFNQLEQVYNDIHTPKSKIPQQPMTDKANRNQTQFRLYQVSPTHGIPEKIASRTNENKPLSISTDSGTEMDSITPIIHQNEKKSLRVSPDHESKSFRNLLSPKVRRRHRSDGLKSSYDCPESPTSNRSFSGAMTACIPIRFPKWPQRKRSKSKEQKNPRKKEFSKEDIHVLPPNSVIPHLHQKVKLASDTSLIPDTSPTYCGVASLPIDQSNPQVSTPKKSTNTNGPLSPINPGPFSPTESQPSHQYLPLNLVPMSAFNHREEIHSRFPAFSLESPLDINIGKRLKQFPLTPNSSQEREERSLLYERPILKELPSPVAKRNRQPNKPIRTFRTDNTHLLRYKSKSEMNLGVVGVPTPFFDGHRIQFRSQMNGNITPYGVKPEIPAFPPNASQDEVKRSLVNVSNVGYMQPHPHVVVRQPVSRYNRHVRTGSLYENADICAPQIPSVIQEGQATFDAGSAGDLLESQNKTSQLPRPSSINTSDSGSYVQMRIDQSISDEIGQAVTLYKRIVNENSKLIRLFSDQLYKQLMQGMNWETVDWDGIEIVDNQRPPLNIAILVQQNELQKEFSLWPKDPNPDDLTSRAFQSIQAISSSIPRSPYVLYAHSLIDIPAELKRRCPCLQPNEVACVLDQTRAGSLEQHLIEHKPLLDLDPEKYERNIVIYLIQILSGVAHLHRHKVVHRDLNMSDILLSRDTEADEILQVKISGFTYSLHRPGPPRSQPFLYTFEELQWLGGDETKLPPEITNAQNNVPELNYSGTDCFAVGCLIYEMMHERNPFDDQNLITNSYTTEELPNFVQRSKYTGWIEKVAKGLLEMNIQRRLDATYALAILHLLIFDGERLLTDPEVNEKKIKNFLADLQGRYLNRIIEKSSMTLVTGRGMEMNVFEKIELNFLANSQPYTIVRAVKHFQNIS